MKLNRDESTSLGITTAIFLLLLLALFIFKQNSASDDLADLEGGGGGGGVTVNFGDSEFGSGADFRSEVLDVSQKAKSTPVATPEVEEEEVVASDVDDAPAVANTKPLKKEPKKQAVKPEVKPKDNTPKPSKSTTDALSSMLNGNNKGGDGDDDRAGNKGQLGGDKNSSGYYGDGGSGGGKGGGNGSGDGTGTGPGTGSGSGGGNGGGVGSGNGNYKLAGRKVLAKPQPNYTCNEQGTVVVSISVDQNGKVISASPGAKGTTNAAKCLLDQAKIAAMNTKFDASNSAPDKQVGTIVYRFTLTE
nr:energy transducer TonB [uncultured Flavobacterium sp.]